MVQFIEQHFDTIVIISVVVIAIVLVLCLIAKLFKLAIGVAILAVVIPIIFTIFWGDGSAYVSKFASFFNPKYQEQIESAYQYYKDKDAEDPFVDYDAVKDAVSDALTDVFKPSEG